MPLGVSSIAGLPPGERTDAIRAIIDKAMGLYLPDELFAFAGEVSRTNDPFLRSQAVEGLAEAVITARDSGNSIEDLQAGIEERLGEHSRHFLSLMEKSALR
jgi:hypothetical protein